VYEETSVDEVTFRTNDCALRLTGRDLEELRAKYVIDASGRNSVIGTKFNLKKSYEHLKKLSLFAHYEGLERESGIDGTLTRMVRTLRSWFWIIPLKGDRTSIGIVLDAAEFRNSKLSPEDFFERAVGAQPLVSNRI